MAPSLFFSSFRVLLENCLFLPSSSLSQPFNQTEQVLSFRCIQLSNPLQDFSSSLLSLLSFSSSRQRSLSELISSCELIFFLCNQCRLRLRMPLYCVVCPFAMQLWVKFWGSLLHLGVVRCTEFTSSFYMIFLAWLQDCILGIYCTILASGRSYSSSSSLIMDLSQNSGSVVGVDMGSDFAVCGQFSMPMISTFGCLVQPLFETEQQSPAPIFIDQQNYSISMRGLLLVLLCWICSSVPFSNFLNSRMIVRKNCEWTASRIKGKGDLLSRFFSDGAGECLYALSEVDSMIYLVLELKGGDWEDQREIVMDVKLPLKVGVGPYRGKVGRELTVSFKDPHSQKLFGEARLFNRQTEGKDILLSLSAKRNKMQLTLPGSISFSFIMDQSQSSYNQELVFIWLLFIMLNYHWFYFNKNEGLILRQYRSVKKGWCFKAVSIFWINHTTFPINLHHQFQKFAEYVRGNQSQILQIGVLLALMGAIVMFIGFQMAKLMKKVSFLSRDQLHVREVVDYILILGVLVTPFEYLVIIMPATKLIQIWHLLTLQESHYISYYEHFGKVSFDWLEGLYFTLYSNNFAELPTNFTAAGFIMTIFFIQLTIFLMELFSHRQFQQLRESSLQISKKLQNFYKKTEARRAEIDSCSICLESFSSSGCLEVVDQAENETYECTTIAVTRCDHKFHSSCLQKWFRDGNDSCPLDRQNLKHHQNHRRTPS